jgi:hypothetical protein
MKFSDHWPNFKVEEVLSPTQLQLFERKGVFPYSFRALDKLQEFRTFVGLPFLINHGSLERRGARSMKDVFEINSQTRGRERAWEWSFHLWCAFDISVEGMSPMDLYEKAIDFGKWGGIGIYNTFVHVDDRDWFDMPQRWDARYSLDKDKREA